MQRPAPRDLLSALTLPLRDVARGLRAAGHVTEPILRNASSALPAGIAEALRTAVERAGDLGARSIGVADPTHAEIIAASKALALRSSASQIALAKVVAAGLQHLIDTHPDHPQMTSETVSAIAARSALSRLPKEATAAEAGAALADALLTAHAVGQFPGTPVTGGAAAEQIARHAVVAVMLWLLADRAPGLHEDITLLDLCAALVDGLGADVEAAAADPAALARLLSELADVV